MKIYLAGPMRGYPDYNFPAFHMYATLLRAEGHEVFNPAELKLEQESIRAIMAVETDWICREAEAMAMMPGWSESLGARAELALARALGLKATGIPGFLPTQPPARPSQSEPESSTTSPSLSRKLPRYHSPDNSSMGPLAGIGLSQRMRQMLLFAIILGVWVGIPTGTFIVLKWLGVH